MPELQDAMRALAEGVELALEVAQEVLPAGFPDKVWETAQAGLRAQSEAFLRGIA